VLKGVQVAIKVDSPSLLEQPQKMRRMLAQQYVYEVKTLYEYCHPNICALIAHCADGPTRSLVYELCEGGNLLDRIAAVNHPPLTWPQRVKIAVGIARGIGFLHSATPHPIVHRDVKTSNILLDANNEAKISDFGTIREQTRGQHTDIKNMETHLTTRMVIGTDNYMPPEYVKHGKISPKLDAFAFGVCLLELLSGRRPTADLLELFDTHATHASISDALDPRVADWALEEALVVARMGMGCQETLTSKRWTVLQVLPQLEGLL
jgi:serine/threonine protein kinase